VAYFIYLVTQPITFPLPLKLVEEYGEDWWKPEHIISNGPFRLLEFDAEHGLLKRNPDYFGEFSGNLDQFTWNSCPAATCDYLNGQADYAPLHCTISQQKCRRVSFLNQVLFTGGLNLIPDSHLCACPARRPD
jgi:ABC-type oligopeptide transport system substrate-binding subunit